MARDQHHVSEDKLARPWARASAVLAAIAVVGALLLMMATVGGM